MQASFKLINVYGKIRARPCDAVASALCRLASTHSLSIEQIEMLSEINGLSLNVEMSDHIAEKLSEQIASHLKK